jgi:DNA-binding PadR family transcriptional regulator
MKVKDSYLGEFEEIVLLAVLKLGKNAYGMSIRELVQNTAERSISISAIYATLDRLERKGFLGSWQGGRLRARRRASILQGGGYGFRRWMSAARVRSTLMAGLKVGIEPA